LIRNLIEQFYVPLASTIAAVGNIKKYQIYTSILNFLPLVGTYILFKLGFRPEYMYMVFIGYSFLSLILTQLIAKSSFQFPVLAFFINTVLRASLVLFICVGSIYFFSHLIPVSIVRLILVGVTSLLFSILLILFVGLTKKERSYVINSVNILFKIKVV
jgi:hypothetical protein